MSQVVALEQQLKNAKQLVEQRRLALRLSQNRDFRKLILEEFCEKEAARYVQNSANPALGADERADSLAIAQASGHLKRWLSVQVQMGAHAEREIEDLETALEQARADEDADPVDLEDEDPEA